MAPVASQSVFRFNLAISNLLRRIATVHSNGPVRHSPKSDGSSPRSTASILFGSQFTLGVHARGRITRNRPVLVFRQHMRRVIRPYHPAHLPSVVEDEFPRIQN